MRYEKATPGTCRARDRLAAHARNALAAAGLPLMPSDLEVTLGSGAEIEVDYGADAAGGVYATWRLHPQLARAAAYAIGEETGEDDPALLFSGAVAVAMERALGAILTAAGFTVEEADDEYRPFTLRIVAGPAGGPDPWADPE
ncbi:hypothetical protein [Actinomadura kijaniata]|uniref:hypothetical protein n=1 Tax=Actinomadura kijaniata TaxID=46161 RepID=UPI000830B56D|nr:hypothetical protein [Actinomadura kijaniata]